MRRSGFSTPTGEVAADYEKRVSEAKFRPLDGLRTDMPPDQIAGLSARPRRTAPRAVPATQCLRLRRRNRP